MKTTKLRFKKGEKVVDSYGRPGVIKEIVQRDDDYKFLFVCLVEFEGKKFFSGKTYKFTEWINQVNLYKFL